MNTRTYIMLLVGLSLPAQVSRAEEAPPAVDTSQWKCRFCAFEEGLAAHVEAGIGAVSDDSAKFGEYTGLNEEGPFLIGNAIVRSRGEDAAYWNLRVRNLGLDSRAIAIDGGRQGSYALSFDYSQLPHFLSDSAVTPFSGGTQLSLPAGWVGASTTTGMTALPASLHTVDIETQRKRLGAGGTFVTDSPWQYQVSYRRDDKEGHKRTAGAFFFNSAHFLEPVDYQVDLFDASAAYNGKALQARFAYHGSFFRNQAHAQSWQNPYSTTGAVGARALPPDNQFHQLSAALGYQLTRDTRLMADLAVGRMTQDEGFLSPTTNTALAVPALPRNSLDGRVNTLNANVKLVSDVTDKLRLNASLLRDDRDNQTPQAAYSWVSSDTFVNTARTNLPYSFTHDAIRVSADYRLPRRSKVAAGFDRDVHERTHLEARETRENTYWAQAKTSMFDTVSLGLKYAHAQREGDYQVVAETVPPQNPLMRKYNLADRERDVLGARLTLLPVERVTIGLGVDMAQDDYSKSLIGVTEGNETTLSADITAAFTGATSAHLFYNHQLIESKQAGSQSFSTPDWFAENEDAIDTLGIGVKHQLIADRLDVGVDYVLSQSRGKIRLRSGTEYSFPDLVADLTSIKLYGTYRIASGLAINAAFLHEEYVVDDWSVDGVTPATMPTVLTLGEQTPDYDVNVITVSLRYAFK